MVAETFRNNWKERAEKDNKKINRKENENIEKEENSIIFKLVNKLKDWCYSNVKGGYVDNTPKQNMQ